MGRARSFLCSKVSVKAALHEAKRRKRLTQAKKLSLPSTKAVWLTFVVGMRWRNASAFCRKKRRACNERVNGLAHALGHDRVARLGDSICLQYVCSSVSEGGAE